MTSLKSILPTYLHTSRLTLQLFDYSPEHYTCILTAINTPTAHQTMGDFGITTPEALDKLNFGTRVLSTNFRTPVDVDTDLYYLLRLGDENCPLMGCVSLAQRGEKIPPDMGWCLFEEYHGKGYATEAAKELLRMLCDDFGIEQVIFGRARRI